MTIRQVPVNRLPDTQSQQCAPNRGQHGNPARQGVGLVGKYQLDLAPCARTFVSVNQAGIHGDNISWDTIRRNDNRPIQLVGQIMIPDNLAQTDIIIHGDNQIVAVCQGDFFCAVVGGSFVFHNGACYPDVRRLIRLTIGIKMYLEWIQFPGSFVYGQSERIHEPRMRGCPAWKIIPPCETQLRLILTQHVRDRSLRRLT